MLDQAFPRQSVQWKDRTITFARAQLTTQRAFKEELEREALQAIQRKRDLFSAADYAEALRAVSRDFAARVYAWEGPEWQRAIGNLDWYKRMLWHVLIQAVFPEKQSLNPWITPDLMETIWEDLSYPAEGDKLAGNLLDDAYIRLLRPDPPKPPPNANGTPGPAAASPSTAAS
jgi:hypothetical protein